jgi:hypothetical protein
VQLAQSELTSECLEMVRTQRDAGRPGLRAEPSGLSDPSRPHVRKTDSVHQRRRFRNYFDSPPSFPRRTTNEAAGSSIVLFVRSILTELFVGPCDSACLVRRIPMVLSAAEAEQVDGAGE